MKRIYLILILLSFVNCKETDKTDKASQENSPVIAEIIRHDEVYIQLNDTTESFFTNLRMNEFQDRPDLVEIGKGTGLNSITVPTESKIEMLGGKMSANFRYNLELERGDSVMIDFEKLRLNDQHEINIPVFEISNTSKNWSEINFEGLLYKKNVRTNAIGVDTTKSFFFTSWNSEEMFQNALSLLDSLKSENKISDEFYINEKENQQYEFARKKLNEQELDQSEVSHSVVIDDLEIQLNQEGQTGNPSYIMLLRAIIEDKHFKDNKRALNTTKFDFVLNTPTFLNNELRTAVLDSYLKTIYFLEKNRFPEYVEKFNQENSKPELQQKWNEVLTNFENNQRILNTSNRNIGLLLNLTNDNELTFEEILKAQKGKIVLVDFWASWCAPCIQEIPAMKNLKSFFEKDQFQVIEISIDKDYAAWERVSGLVGLEKYEHSYIITNWEESNLHKTYSIKTIPRYLLFDKEGMIISENAPRPSNQELKELIRASL